MRGCLEKRSPALRGRNRARDIQADGAPMAALASGWDLHRGPALFLVIGRRSHALKNPSAKRQSPPLGPCWILTVNPKAEKAIK
jgi:hypothetical protein